MNKKSETDWQNVVTKLQKIAIEQNVSQNKLAELTGINQPNIARFYSCRVAPNIRTLVLIAQALNYKIDVTEC